jgi:hypothetical protein
MTESPAAKIPLYLNLSLVMALLTLATWVGGQTERLSGIDRAVVALNEQVAQQATTIAAMAAAERSQEHIIAAADAELNARLRRIEEQQDQGARPARRQ